LHISTPKLKIHLKIAGLVPNSGSVAMKFVRICLVAGLIPFSLAAHAEVDDAVIKAMADTLAGKPAEAFEARETPTLTSL